jgi:hypothetical protein
MPGHRRDEARCVSGQQSRGEVIDEAALIDALRAVAWRAPR